MRPVCDSCSTVSIERDASRLSSCHVMSTCSSGRGRTSTSERAVIVQRRVRREHVERGDARAEVVDVLVDRRRRLDVERRVQHELAVGRAGQHPRLVVRGRDVAVVAEPGLVLDAQSALHEISPIQLGSACVGKNRWRIASDASRVTVCTRCMCCGQLARGSRRPGGTRGRCGSARAPAAPCWSGRRGRRAGRSRSCSPRPAGSSR